MTVVAFQSSGGGSELIRPDGRPTVGKIGTTVERATLTVYEPAKGGGRGSLLDTITFQFNPTTVIVTKTATWEAGASKWGRISQFTAWVPCTMTLDVFLDATSCPNVGVVTTVEKLMACCVPTAKSRNTKKPSPPLVVLTWGKVTSFPAYLTSVTATYSLFSADGMPIRATCALSLTEMYSNTPRQNPTSGSEAVRRVHRTVAGDTLASVAYAEYGDPASWRPLAAWNGIDDPLRVAIGTMIELPTPAELAR